MVPDTRSARSALTEPSAIVTGSPLDEALGIVADDHQVAVLAGQQLQPAVLGVVGVLVLVDHHVAKAARVARADLGEELEHVDGADQQVVEVHRVGRGAARRS